MAPGSKHTATSRFSMQVLRVLTSPFSAEILQNSCDSCHSLGRQLDDRRNRDYQLLYCMEWFRLCEGKLWEDIADEPDIINSATEPDIAVLHLLTGFLPSTPQPNMENQLAAKSWGYSKPATSQRVFLAVCCSCYTTGTYEGPHF